MHHILLIDDEPGVVAALTRLLRHTPLSVGGVVSLATVEGFVSARQALARAAEHAFDLAVCDYRMPEMSGVDALCRLRELQPDCARVILSGYTDLNGLIGAINQAHIDRFVAKPWNDFELVCAIGQILEIRALRLENETLADLARCERGQISRAELELQRLERMEPGLTRVHWGPDGSVVMDAAGLLPDTRF
ncbi:MAG: response regulator [Burkholderiaceae bacterium]